MIPVRPAAPTAPTLMTHTICETWTRGHPSRWVILNERGERFDTYPGHGDTYVRNCAVVSFGTLDEAVLYHVQWLDWLDRYLARIGAPPIQEAPYA